MSLAYFVYITLGALSIFFARYSVKYNNGLEKAKWDPFGILIIISVSVILGMRFNVGEDYMSYLHNYRYSEIFKQSYVDFEVFFQLITSVLSFIRVHFAIYFIVLNIIIWYFLVKCIRNIYFIFPFFVFSIFTDGFLFFTINGIRQAISISMLFYAFSFINEKSKVKYLITIVCAGFFHKTALFFVPFCFFIHKDIFNNRFVTFSLIAVSTIIDFSGVINSIAIFVANLLGYGFYAENLELAFDNQLEVGSGMGMAFRLLVDSTIIMYGPSLKRSYENIKPYFNMLVLGVVLYFLFDNIHLLARFNNYFLFFRVIMLGFLLHYLFILNRNKFNFLYGVGLVFLYVCFFIYSISTSFSLCAPFNFFFMK